MASKTIVPTLLGVLEVTVICVLLFILLIIVLPPKVPVPAVLVSNIPCTKLAVLVTFITALLTAVDTIVPLNPFPGAVRESVSTVVLTSGDTSLM